MMSVTVAILLAAVAGWASSRQGSRSITEVRAEALS